MPYSPLHLTQSRKQRELVSGRISESVAAMKSSRALLIAGILGLSGVALGAFGAHALRAQLTELGTRDRWETAVHYHLLHAVAIFAAAIWLELGTGASAVARRIGWAVRWWLTGVVLFSGSLYCLALKAPTWLGASTAPLGGVSFLIGWSCVIVAARGVESGEK